LRTPLHTIIGFSELLSEEVQGNLNADQKRFLGHVLQDARHLLELINEVLDISKVESGKLELQRAPFDFQICVAEVLTNVQQQAATKGLRMESKIDFEGLLDADRLRIKEILYNLLSNAVKFTEQGGHVCVEALIHDSLLQVTVQRYRNWHPEG
jgi:signal transduction histidine kinase